MFMFGGAETRKSPSPGLKKNGVGRRSVEAYEDRGPGKENGSWPFGGSTSLTPLASLNAGAVVGRSVGCKDAVRRESPTFSIEFWTAAGAT